MSDHGVVTGEGILRFERLLPGPIERVWTFLTESEQRGRWLATGNMELRVGGRVELLFRHADLTSSVEPTPEKFKRYEYGTGFEGRVTRCEPPRVLSYTWGGEANESEVTFELTPRGDATLLVLTHRRLGKERAVMANVASGWHTHLGILTDALGGVERRPFWSTHARMEAEYTERLAET
ncbi:SRPBCC family protein [Pyxidicoccus xibeiensis]|uniref:SRPBCC family protein n=1 Tax=Pyxidicoccus xibeiensis TaxID=2906759 RepID=UPI0020A82AD4|nr:SRPBCC family protein [Pyxidicoccus xibeiensis]MCP3143938.1 SRPBCC family protein [Pyxidicoccus xibeiensis]